MTEILDDRNAYDANCNMNFSYMCQLHGMVNNIASRLQHMESLNENSKEKSFKCGQCSERFSKYDVMKAHRKSHAIVGGSVEYKCTETGCNKVFTMKGGLR